MNEILIIGLMLFFGYLGGRLIAKVKVPAVTGYILVGFAFGVSFLHLIPQEWNQKLAWLIDFALLLVAFTIGGELRLGTLRRFGTSIFSIVLLETLGAYFCILLAMFILHQPLALSLLIASIGSATAPAVTVLVLDEYGAQGPLTQTLLACVGLDDALGLAIYSVSASLAHNLLLGVHVSAPRLVEVILLEIAVSVALGLGFGFILSRLLGYIRYPVEMLTVSLGTIMLMGGVLRWEGWGFHFSPLLASMTLGFYISNFSPRRRDVFTPLGNFSYPFYTIYFVLAGARLQVGMLVRLGWVALGYIVGRFVGKIVGASLGATLSRATPAVRKYTGLGLFSQAGIAIGLCLLAANEFPQLGNVVVAIGLGTTIVTEIVGPLSTKYAITRAREVGRAGVRLERE